MSKKPEDKAKTDLKHNFCDAISDLISPNNFKGTSLNSYIKQRARIWKVDHLDTYEIFIEGVARGIAYIDKTGQPIKVPEAWLRKVCLNILRDETDKVIKGRKEAERQNHELRDAYKAQAHSGQPDLIDHFEHADEALNSLSPKDRELIKLRFFESKTYEQIQHYYELQEEVVSITALRKRESRALKRLRAKFSSIHTRD
jgi:RNA polymerase sigma factor (sigma-70 family)